jgi:hypothetical protein
MSWRSSRVCPPPSSGAGEAELGAVPRIIATASVAVVMTVAGIAVAEAPAGRIAGTAPVHQAGGETVGHFSYGQRVAAFLRHPARTGPVGRLGRGGLLPR